MDLCNVKEVKALLEKHGFRFSKSMGQNFLIADWVPQRIAEQSGIGPETGVLEIGPGIGCLTSALSQRTARVTAVELDKKLLPVLAESLSDCDNVEIISGDILKLDLPQLTAQQFAGLTPTVCANLPYNITTPVLTRLIDSGCFASITVMIQREVARRICAPAGTADYGAFSVYVNYHTEPTILFDVPPSCFLPQPKVYSSVITLKKRVAPPVSVQNESLFFRTVRGAFAQRRKTLINSLSAVFGDKLSKDTLTEILTSCGFDTRIRGEVLTLSDFALLSNLIEEHIK